jgi:hypothetical protein
MLWSSGTPLFLKRTRKDSAEVSSKFLELLRVSVKRDGWQLKLVHDCFLHNLSDSTFMVLARSEEKF